MTPIFIAISEGPKADNLKCGFKKVFEKHVENTKNIYLESSFTVRLKKR